MGRRLLRAAVVVSLWAAGVAWVPLGAAPASAALEPPAGADVELVPGGNGFWVLDEKGRVQPFGTAPYLGGAPALATGEIVVSMSSTPSGLGYWLFSSSGRVFPYGDPDRSGLLHARFRRRHLHLR